MLFTDIKLPPQVQQKIQSYHSLTNEILRHFWSSYEPYKAEKNLRMVESLKKQQEKLKEVLIAVVSYEGDPEKCKQV
jgi:transcription initiation factor TFIIH subunit 1